VLTINFTTFNWNAKKFDVDYESIWKSVTHFGIAFVLTQLLGLMVFLWALDFVVGNQDGVTGLEPVDLQL
jgi:hypothetical protein